MLHHVLIIFNSPLIIASLYLYGEQQGGQLLVGIQLHALIAAFSNPVVALLPIILKGGMRMNILLSATFFVRGARGRLILLFVTKVVT